MTEATLDAFRSSRAPAAGEPRGFDGAPLRWTPGPDELRLPSSEEEMRLLSREAESVPWNTRNSYVMWEEGKPPDFVLEVVSPSSRRRDRREKPEIYAKIGVPEFFLYDPEDESEPALSGLGPALSGFELRGGAGGAYRPLPKERLPGGVAGVRSKVLGLCLCVKPTGPEPLDGALRWYDPAADEFLPTRHELADAKRQAEASAEASAARVAELEALVEKMRRG